ncbi:hypothetical protein KNCP2_12800 [Candidatus Rickettsia kedanie]|uniref:Uncharacterized protein n=1 Tax=Candidatus Rickettsia kedanie TaxID=3115352 RepID=A0ABP9TYF7_9RICK
MYKGQPVGLAKGMAFHESQSLFMEMQVGRSREFTEFLAKLLRDEFALKSEEYSAENLYRKITRVKPDFIRVDADEVTICVKLRKVSKQFARNLLIATLLARKNDI